MDLFFFIYNKKTKSMNLNQIYEKLKKQAELSGQEINESHLRQQAWMIRDRMMFEKSYSDNFYSSYSSGSVGGRILDNTINNYVENGYVENYFE
jgi:hypothetical protein